MNIGAIMAIGQHALWVMMLLAAPLLLSGLIVGLIVSILQAATQINEMTLSFIPKILVMGVVVLVAGGWMLHVLVDYTFSLIHSIPEIVNG